MCLPPVSQQKVRTLTCDAPQQTCSQLSGLWLEDQKDTETYIMAIADQLLELMFSWIDQRECCAEQLRKLAKELESCRKNCNISECVGTTVSVAGSACMIAAGVATLFTGGAAAPLLGMAGAVCTGAGATVSVGTKIIEGFKSSDTIKEAQEIEKKSNEVAEEIQKLFEQLKVESFSTDPNKQDRHVMTEILKAIARRSGLKGRIRIRRLDKELQILFDKEQSNERLNQSFLNPEVMVSLGGILAFFALQLCGKTLKRFLAKGAEQLIKHTCKGSALGTDQFIKTGAKGAKNIIKQMSSKALKGGVMVVGGAVGLAFELPEAIDNWTDLIKKNHVTEASQSLRDTADAILEITGMLGEQFNIIKQIFDEMVKRHEEKASRRKRLMCCLCCWL
ncbi:uncharacterized protein LOC127374565 isoform X2 [Dicentrarchus labrax]|uniref:uncharacterized protein LOC127374565 isoform X2 n=1 Tax=Dicentrarchus labrax TaxID=13489 RepID=UPI0021F60BF8|nr:uncharacterized protein LOC127374565 isoform X2 [Dicentrarchus labrax]